MADVAGFFKKIAPFLTTALRFGGPAGQLASAAIRTAQVLAGGKVESVDDLAAAMAKSPDQQKFMLDLKNAEQQFQLQMEQMQINSADELEKIAADDRASARQREVALKDKMPTYLALMAVASLLLCILLMAFVPLPQDAREAILILIGFVGASYKDVYAYFFGSSHGSEKKTEMLAAKTKAA